MISFIEFMERDSYTDKEIKDIFTFGRAIGRIFINGEDMSTMMIKAGHATETKQ